jgi:hypothetical protein
MTRNQKIAIGVAAALATWWFFFRGAAAGELAMRGEPSPPAIPEKRRTATKVATIKPPTAPAEIDRYTPPAHGPSDAELNRLLQNFVGSAGISQN